MYKINDIFKTYTTDESSQNYEIFGGHYANFVVILKLLHFHCITKVFIFINYKQYLSKPRYF